MQDGLQSTCAFAGAAVLRPVDGSTRSSEAAVANPAGVSTATVFIECVAPGGLTVDRKGTSADNGILRNSAVCTYIGSMPGDRHAETKEIMCRCHDALFNPVKAGSNHAGTISRNLSNLPIISVDGKLIVAGNFIGFAGAKRG
jgi:Rieske Fe-S protein